MLPCTRRCLTRRVRCKAPSAAEHRQPPQAPLRCLYPRWFADSSLRAQVPAPDSATDPSEHQDEEGSTNDRPPVRLVQQVNGRISDPEMYRWRRVECRRTQLRDKVDKTELQGTVDSRRDRLPRSKFTPRSEYEQQLAREIVSKPSFQTARDDIQLDTQQTIPQRALKAIKRKRAQNRIQSWYGLVHLLLSLPSKPTQRDGTAVRLRHQLVSHHAGSLRPNRWNQNVGSGSYVEVLPSSRDREKSRKLLLYGTERAVELGQEFLEELDHKRETLAISHLSTSPHTCVKNISLATVDSPSTFTQYVLQLTSRYVPRAVRDATTPSLNTSIAEALVVLFRHPQATHHASIVAVNHALRFLCLHDELNEAARTVYNRAKTLGIGMNTSTANMLLRSAIRRSDASEARWVLKEMFKSDVPADGHTWSLVFTVIQPEQKLPYLDLMQMKQIKTDPGVVAALRLDIVEHIITDPNPSAKELQDVLQTLDNTFGKKWITLDIYHKLLRLFGNRLSNEASALLKQIPIDRGLNPTGKTWLYLNALARDSGMSEPDITSFLEALFKVEEPAEPRLAIPSFFIKAWNASYYNMCAILWANAATRGCVTYKMQSTVNKHLLRNHTGLSRTSSRKSLGARIIAGLLWRRAQDADAFWQIFPKLYTHFDGDIASMLNGYTPDDGTRDEQLSFVYVTINEDLTAHKKFLPMSKQYFTDKLYQAYKRDREWISAGRLDSTDETEVAKLLEEARRDRVQLKRLRSGQTNTVTEKAIEQARRLTNQEVEKDRGWVFRRVAEDDDTESWMLD